MKNQINCLNRLPSVAYIRSLTVAMSLWLGLYMNTGCMMGGDNAENAYGEQLTDSNQEKYHLLRKAIKENDSTLLEEAIDKGANPICSFKDKNGHIQSSLNIAISEKSTECFPILLEKGGLDIIIQAKRNPFYQLSDIRKDEKINSIFSSLMEYILKNHRSYLLKKENLVNYRTILHYYIGDLEKFNICVEKLKHCGDDYILPTLLIMKDINRKSPLALASASSITVLLKALKPDILNLKGVEDLLERENKIYTEEEIEKIVKFIKKDLSLKKERKDIQEVLRIEEEFNDSIEKELNR